MMASRILHTLLYICIALTSLPALGQRGTREAQLSWEDFVEALTDGNEEEEAADAEGMERLYELHTNPLDLNTATKGDLMALPFLSEEQVDDLLLYVAKNRPVQSLGELMFVRSLGKADRERLRLFVAEPEQVPWGMREPLKVNARNLMRQLRQEVVWRTDVPFYQKAGYADVPAEVLTRSPNKVYRGDRLHHRFRYAATSMGHLLVGVNMEKDAGERGADYVSGYAMWKDQGIVKRAIVGDYRLSFGKGLAVNSSARFGKTMMLQAMDRMDEGIRQHSSASEAGYFTGGAATLRWGRVEVSAFGSWRHDDGTYASDSTGMTSLKTDGLHRTQLEHSKKGNLGITHCGGNIHWEHRSLRLSATAIASHLSVPLTPRHDTAGSLYRYYNAHGQDFQVGSVAYALRCGTLAFSGETALSHCERQRGTATLNALRWQVDGDNVLTLLARYYGAKFVSLNGKAFGENATPQNEEGLFLGWSTMSVRNLSIEAFVDAMYFPWLKSQVSGSSTGVEALAQATYSRRGRWSLLVRYHLKSKQRDYDYTLNGTKATALQYKTRQDVKMQLNCALSPRLTLRTSAAGLVSSFGPSPAEHGFTLGENLRWQDPDTKLRLDLGILYFHTDSYDSRIYAYEPSLLYAFASTAFHDQGVRTTLLGSVPLMRNTLSLQAKLGLTHYFNRDTIGTGLEQIDANHREDLLVQLRWKF